MPEAAVPDHHHVSPGEVPADPLTRAIEAQRDALDQLGQALVRLGRECAVLAHDHDDVGD